MRAGRFVVLVSNRLEPLDTKQNIVIGGHIYVVLHRRRRMREDEFIDYLDGHHTEFEYMRGEHQGNHGVFIKNIRFDTKMHMTYNTIEDHDLDALIKATHGGKNVEQITRVTGFFSKASGWNKGKRGELSDRYRSDI